MGGERAELRRRVSVAVALAAASLAGCTTASETVPFVEADADAGARDAARADTNGSDAGDLDASGRDTSATMDDASLPDGASSDAAVDAGPPDFGCIGDQPCAIAHVAAGPMYTCFVRQDGAVYCWGRNHSGLLGYEGDSAVPRQAVGLPPMASTSPGLNNACGLSSDGVPYCWGGSYPGPDLTAIELTDVHRISTGFLRMTCAIHSDAQLACWGTGFHFSPPLAGLGEHYTPVELPELGRIVDVSVGQEHACAVTEDGSVLCWGYNQYGQLGQGEEVTESPPAQVLGIENAIAVGTGVSHSCALSLDGNVDCWGRWPTADGVETYHSPRRLTGLPPLTSLAVGTITWAICGTSVDGRVWCSGANRYGQLGAGFMTPVGDGGSHEVIGLENIEHVSFGGYHACALDTEHRMWCWGRNDDWQLGDGTTVDRSVPTPFTNPT